MSIHLSSSILIVLGFMCTISIGSAVSTTNDSHLSSNESDSVVNQTYKIENSTDQIQGVDSFQLHPMRSKRHIVDAMGDATNNHQTNHDQPKPKPARISPNGDDPFGIIYPPTNDDAGNQLAAQFLPEDLKRYIARKYAEMMAARTTTPGLTTIVSIKPDSRGAGDTTTPGIFGGKEANGDSSIVTSSKNTLNFAETSITTTTSGPDKNFPTSSTIPDFKPVVVVSETGIFTSSQPTTPIQTADIQSASPTDTGLVASMVKEAENGANRGVETGAKSHEGEGSGDVTSNCQVMWSRWTPCTKSCDKGLRIRTGQVIKEPANGGKPCSSLLQAEYCNEKACPEAIPLDCTKLNNGIYVWPTENCTNRFVVCSNGHPTAQQCPSSLFFNPKTNRCDIWARVFACSGEEIEETSTTSSSAATAANSRRFGTVVDFSCGLGMDNGLFEDPMNNCSNRYFACSNFRALELHCPSGLFFDEGRQECDSFMSVEACTGVRSTTTASTTANSRRLANPIKSPVDCPFDAITEISDPKKKCSSVWYTCVWGVDYMKNCPQGLFYDPTRGYCDTFHNIEACTGIRSTLASSPPSTTTTAHSSTTPGLTFDCSSLSDGQHKAGDCEAFYWTCSHGNSYRQWCPFGLRFDAQESLCGFQREIPGCNGTRPVTTTTTEKTANFIDENLLISENDKCEQAGKGDNRIMRMIMEKGGCSQQFYVCKDGIAIRFDCPDGLVFNPSTSFCAEKNQVEECST